MMRQVFLFLKTFSFFLLLSGFLALPKLSAQEIIGQHRLKDCSVEKSIYPYGWIEYGGDYHEVGFKPIVKLNESDFAYLWKPIMGFRKYMLTSFNLLMEQHWEIEVKLEEDEDIFHVYRADDQVVLLSYMYKSLERMHNVRARKFAAEDGSLEEQRFIYQYWGKNYQVLGYDISADSSTLAFYHFLDDDNNKKVRNMGDYPYPDGGAGFKVTNSTRAAFQVYNLQLDTLSKGEMPLLSSMKAKSYVVDGQVDNEGNMVFTIFQEPHFLAIHRHDIASGENQMLRYEGFSDPFKNTPYGAMLPPHIGREGRVYAAFAGRERLRGRRYTRFFKVINFDFGKGLIDSSRTVPISSTFQVQLNKTREEVKLEPETIFDHYLIRDLIEMDDGALWMIAQKYERGSQPKRVNARTVNLDDTYVSTMEEILLFEFEPRGKIHKVIMVPLLQQAILPMERVGRFYTYQIDKQNQILHLVTREYDGEKHTGPPRIFYRKIDLQAGSYSPRQQIYNGRKRTQYYLRDYTLFLNSSVAILTVIDGDMEDNPDIVSVKLEDLK